MPADTVQQPVAALTPALRARKVSAALACSNKVGLHSLRFVAISTVLETANSVVTDKPWQFRKGQSGNPSGRPKVVADVRDLAQKHTKDAIAALVDVLLNSKVPAARVAAANVLLDRGYGKPLQTQDVTVRQLEIADALAPYLDQSRKEELARLLGTLRANAARN